MGPPGARSGTHEARTRPYNPVISRSDPTRNRRNHIIPQTVFKKAFDDMLYRKNKIEKYKKTNFIEKTNRKNFIEKTYVRKEMSYRKKHI